MASNPPRWFIGAGIAGMPAALDMANAGFQVYLVERLRASAPMAQLDKTLPDARLLGLHPDAQDGRSASHPKHPPS